MAAATVLLIGVGNTLRGDDGAGPLLAEALARELAPSGWETRVRLAQQLVPELAVEMVAPEVKGTIICDARLADDERSAGLQLLRLESPAVGDPTPETFTHEITAGTLLAYADSLRVPARHLGPCWLASVPAYAMELGEGLSAATARALDGAPALAATLLRELARN